jgi:hypothetical protein
MTGSGLGPLTDSCEHDNKPKGSIKGGKFLDSMRGSQLLKMDPVKNVRAPTEDKRDDTKKI